MYFMFSGVQSGGGKGGKDQEQSFTQKMKATNKEIHQGSLDRSEQPGC